MGRNASMGRVFRLEISAEGINVFSVSDSRVTNGTDIFVGSFRHGTYLLLEAGAFTQTKKVILVK